jgi:hypothetical protein
MFPDSGVLRLIIRASAHALTRARPSSAAALAALLVRQETHFGIAFQSRNTSAVDYACRVLARCHTASGHLLIAPLLPLRRTLAGLAQRLVVPAATRHLITHLAFLATAPVSIFKQREFFHREVTEAGARLPASLRR